jgi:hypothetical protein
VILVELVAPDLATHELPVRFAGNVALRTETTRVMALPVGDQDRRSLDHKRRQWSR